MPMTAEGATGPAELVEVAAGLVFRGGLLLITQRRPQDHLGGLWEFPGGKRGPDETYEECLGANCGRNWASKWRWGSVWKASRMNIPKKPSICEFFRCAWRQHEPRALGCHDFAWVRREQLADYNFPAADARLLEKLAACDELVAGVNARRRSRRSGPCRKIPRPPCGSCSRRRG